MKRVKAGKPLISFIKLCYQAGLPPLLVGKHGVGKSVLIEQAANELNIDYICRDLSLMEPPDLVGMPKIDGGVTRYLPPAFLPRAGKGLLVFEELNRCPAYMRSPCLQLLTARALNDYTLPKGWLPCAAINPAGGHYETHELDAALLSRFVKVEVVPDHQEWLVWAQAQGLSESITEYVASDPKIFTDTSPRDWEYASKILGPEGETDKATLEAALAGVIGRDRLAAFRAFGKGGGPLPKIEALLNQYDSKHGNQRRKVQAWRQNGQTDALDSLAYSLKMLLQDSDVYADLRGKPRLWENLAHFLQDLPPDLSVEAYDFMVERGYDVPGVQP